MMTILPSAMLLLPEACFNPAHDVYLVLAVSAGGMFETPT